jgi:hypothetical protein
VVQESYIISHESLCRWSGTRRGYNHRQYLHTSKYHKRPVRDRKKFTKAFPVIAWREGHVAVYEYPFVYREKEDEMIDQYTPGFGDVTAYTPLTTYSCVNSIMWGRGMSNQSTSFAPMASSRRYSSLGLMKSLNHPCVSLEDTALLFNRISQTSLLQ